MLIQQLTCFKASDVRGASNVNFDANIIYLIGRALTQKLRQEK